MVNNKDIVKLLENLQDLVFIMRFEKGNFYYAFANSVALRYIGNPSDLLGKTIQDILGKKRGDELCKRYKEVVEKKLHITYQDTVIQTNGEIMYGESMLSPSFDENGNVITVISITRDMTQRHLEKRLIIDNQLRYKSLFENNMDGIITLDENGMIVGVNKAVESILNYKESELCEKSILDLISVKSIKAFYSVISPTLLGKSSESARCELLHRDGYYIFVHFKTVPILVNNKVEGIYLIVRDITKQKESEKRIKFLAYHDYLTGLYNRLSLAEHITQSILKYQLRNVEFAVVIIDIDRFKVVNDVLGHQLGDQVIEEFASRLKGFASKGITTYRIGGDEFALLVEPCDQRKVSQLADEVLKCFRKPILLNKNDYYMTCTIGIGMYPSDGTDTESLIKNATVALHRAKENGRGNYQFYNSNLHYLSPRTMGLETSLRRSIECNELVVYYQPQMNIDKNEICGVEALIRWDSIDYGLVSPGEFIPIAEETGFIIEIGEWVIYEVCAQLRKWIDKGYEAVPVGINLSPKQFLSPTLFETVQHALLKNKIHPSLITIEITESAMMDPVRTIEILNQLKGIGVFISVDDFGTGYSSFSYLKKFPIDVLKIDRSFIDEVTLNGKDAAITTSLIQLAHLLQLDVVAEGVETKEQVDFLRSKKCKSVQGYFYSQPIPNDEFEKKYLLMKNERNF